MTAIGREARDAPASSTQAEIFNLESALTVETGLYVLIGLAAVFLRLHALGESPLSQAEAREALAAWRYVVAAGEPLQPVSAAWFTLTSFAFSLFGANEFWARLWPALAGTALIFTPLTFRRELGRGGALVASGLLAISSVLIASSRVADGTTLAALGLWLVVAGWRMFAGNENDAEARGLLLAGLGLGLGLASGPRFLSGLAAGVLAALLVALVRPTFVQETQKGLTLLKGNWSRLLIPAGLTFFLLSSAVMINRPGLSAAGEALPAWIRGWAPSLDGRPIGLVPQILVVYEPLLVMLGIGGLYVAFLSGLWHNFASRFVQIETEPNACDLPWREPAKVLAAVAVGAILFGQIYSGREASDALWVVFPLALLGGRALADLFSETEAAEGEWQTVAAQTAVLFVMLTFAYFNLGAYARSITFAVSSSPYLPLALAGGVLALAVVVTVLFALGWSKRAAVRGGVIALGAIMLVGTIGAGWRLTQRSDNPRELWNPTPTTGNIHLLTKTIEDISDRTVGSDGDLEVVVLNDPTWDDRNGLLAWELRNFSKLKFVDGLSPEELGPVVITGETVFDETLNGTYVGQRFALFGRSIPRLFSLDGFINWWLYRSGGDVEYSRKVLWVRQDVQTLSEKNQ
ncbi:MAG: glycosyltransferase family 39 protein [Chloroflexi bacterium]|nr:glycosyltransferase family 39 protein [Chloroflexota bacterium]